MPQTHPALAAPLGRPPVDQEDDEDILAPLLPEDDDFVFPDDELLAFDHLREPVEVATRPPSFPTRSSVQVLADEVVSPFPATASDPPVFRLKALDPEPPGIVAFEPEEPLEATDWGPGILGQFCCTVADWSDAIADWIDRCNEVLERGRQRAAHLRDLATGWLSRLGV